LLDQTNATESIIRTAYQRWGQDAALQKKWFGVSTAHEDENVKLRFKRAMDMMFEYGAGKKRQWSMMCCRSNQGACDVCEEGSNTVAYVTSKKFTNSDRKISNTNIRFCPWAWKINEGAASISGKGKLALGMTMFHELMHIVSNAGDKGYEKIECINNAISDPINARQNAAAYVYYAQEAGMTRKNYLAATGQAAISSTCYDKTPFC
jgi:hypothetical protein